MIWGGMKTDLVFIQGNLNHRIYINDVINNTIIPLFAAHPQMTLMHDNATPHVARAVTQHLANLGIQVLPWPSKSPDLNPIEHLWDQMERELRARPQPPTNLGELRQALQEVWDAVPAHRVRRLTSSMRRRCLATMAAFGGHTRY